MHFTPSGDELLLLFQCLLVYRKRLQNRDKGEERHLYSFSMQTTNFCLVLASRFTGNKAHYFHGIEVLKREWFLSCIGFQSGQHMSI